MAIRHISKSELFLELAKLRDQGRLTCIGAVRLPGESRNSQFHIIFLKLRSWFSAKVIPGLCSADGVGKCLRALVCVPR